MEEVKYRPVTPGIIRELEEIVGRKYVIHDDAEKLEPYSHDEIPGIRHRKMPEVVVRPASTAEIAAIVRLANREMIPVTPRGAGSGLSGGAVPVYGGIVVATDRMNRILEFDPDNMMVTVEPGVVSNDINEYLKDSGLFYAGYPMSMETCFIGGNVAENAGGGKTVKYGVTSRYVLGLEVVSPTGEVLEMGGKLLKDVTGYNLIPLMTGSEGTLGIFTRITLRLVPRPKYQVDLLCLFASGEEAVSAAPRLMTGTGITPTSLEYMDRQSVLKSCAYLNETLPVADCGAMLIVTLDGSDRKQLEEEYIAVGKAVREAGATEIYVADNRASSERIWRIRRNIPEAFTLATRLQSGEDLVVPPASIPRVVAAFAGIEKKYGVLIPCYGHAGDGNLHSRVTAAPEWDEDTWEQRLPEILADIYRITAENGGRISGEHGIGCKRRPYIGLVVQPEYLNTMRTIKRALDPNGIMNPGKIF